MNRSNLKGFRRRPASELNRIVKRLLASLCGDRVLQVEHRLLFDADQPAAGRSISEISEITSAINTGMTKLEKVLRAPLAPEW